VEFARSTERGLDVEHDVLASNVMEKARVLKGL
jgi:hypothetical protein